MRKKTSPQSFARPQDLGLPMRGLAPQAQRGCRLPTAAALQLALVSSLLVGGVMTAGCSSNPGDGIEADAPRRPAIRTTQEGTSASIITSATVAPAVAPPIDPEPRHVKGEMAPVMPTVIAPPPSAKPPMIAGSTAAIPTTVPRRLGGKPAMVWPTTGAPSPSTPPCDKPITPAST